MRGGKLILILYKRYYTALIGIRTKRMTSILLGIICTCCWTNLKLKTEISCYLYKLLNCIIFGKLNFGATQIPISK